MTLYQRWLYTCAVMLLPLVAYLLKKRGFRKTERILAKWSKPPGPAGDPETLARGQQVAAMVDRASTGGFYRAQRLEAAITLWWMLGLMGIESRVRLGIYKVSGEVQAHAWVLLNDEILLGQAGLEDYEPLVDVNMNRPPVAANDETNTD